MNYLVKTLMNKAKTERNIFKFNFGFLLIYNALTRINIVSMRTDK